MSKAGLVNVTEIQGNVGEQLDILAEITNAQPMAALKQINVLATALLPNYRRKFKDGLLDKKNTEIMECDEQQLMTENLEEHVRLILENIDVEFNNNRHLMKNMFVLYNKEPKYGFGNRLLQLCDLIAGSFQSGLSREEIRTVIAFVSYELQKMSRVIGNDY